MNKLPPAPYRATMTISTPDTPDDELPSCTIKKDTRDKDGLCTMVIHKRISFETAVQIAKLLDDRKE